VMKMKRQMLSQKISHLLPLTRTIYMLEK